MSVLGIEGRIAGELGVRVEQVAATVGLLDEGSTVPFIARYRKEKTGGLDEVQIRDIQERHGYKKELDERRKAILSSIEQQGKLTDALRRQIMGADTKATLEDLYLPYKPKRRTRATIAKERGLEPLAERQLSAALQRQGDVACFVKSAGQIGEGNDRGVLPDWQERCGTVDADGNDRRRPRAEDAVGWDRRKP